MLCLFFFFKQKTAYEMRISDWSSDVCSSDLAAVDAHHRGAAVDHLAVVVGQPCARQSGRGAQVEELLQQVAEQQLPIREAAEVPVRENDGHQNPPIASSARFRSRCPA